MAADDPVVQAILRHMQTPLPKVASFITTTTSAGIPSTRQVSPRVSDDFVVEMLSGPGALKVTHIRRSPGVSCLFVELKEGRPARTAMLHGMAEVITDDAGVQEFLNRRAAPGADPGTPNGRALIRIRPLFLRAEKFMGEDRSNPVVIRDFANPIPERVEG